MAFNFHRAEQGIVLANSHRGFSSRYPENTFPAFTGAVEAGTRCIEIDVSMTADDEIVVIHDHCIDRVSTGTGYVEQMTLAQLRQYDFGIKFSPAFAGTTISTLAEILTWAVANDVGIILEVKQRRRHDRFVARIKEVLLSVPNALSHLQLLGFNHVLINRIKAELPAVALQVVTLERYNNQLAAVQVSHASCVCFEYEFGHSDDLRAYKKAGLGVRMYLHAFQNGEETMDFYWRKFGYDPRPEILGWLREGLIDMLSHDDIDYLKFLIEEAGLRWG